MKNISLSLIEFLYCLQRLYSEFVSGKHEHTEAPHHRLLQDQDAVQCVGEHTDEGTGCVQWFELMMFDAAVVYYNDQFSQN